MINDAEDAHVQAKYGQIVSSCTSLNLRKAARAASHFLEGYFLPIGLRAGQYGVLISISRVGATTMTHLAEALATDRTTLTRNLRLMQRDGWVQIASGRDRRVREITLTDAGCQKLAEAIPLWEQAEACLRARLGQERWQALLSHAEAMSSLVGQELDS